MCASICQNDWIWLYGNSKQKGQVVSLTNPLDKNQTLLRRIVGVPGDTIEFDENGTLRINLKPIRRIDMGFYKDYRLIQENIWSENTDANWKWLTLRHKKITKRRSYDPQKLKVNEYFLMADNRDNALDSRWWGPIHGDLIKNTVYLRIGKPNQWRKRIQFRLPN